MRTSEAVVPKFFEAKWGVGFAHQFTSAYKVHMRDDSVPHRPWSSWFDRILTMILNIEKLNIGKRELGICSVDY